MFFSPLNIVVTFRHRKHHYGDWTEPSSKERLDKTLVNPMRLNTSVYSECSEKVSALCMADRRGSVLIVEPNQR